LPTIAKITNGASAQKALDYALGKNQELHNKTEQWLKDNNLQRDVNLQNTRAVALGVTNGIFAESAKEQFKTVRNMYDQRQSKNQVLRITQSFSKEELNPLNKADWTRANDLGVQLEEKLYPQYQSAVYTHLDGHNHILHNHIIVNKVNFTNGKKLNERIGEPVDRARYFNDDIAKQQGWKTIERNNERVPKTEKELIQKGEYSWVRDIRQKIDSTMKLGQITDFKSFSEHLKELDIIVKERGKASLTYNYIDQNGKQRRIRSSRLGSDYEKGTITNELENRSKRIREQLQPDEQERVNRTIRKTNKRYRIYNKEIEPAEQREQSIKYREQQLSKRKSSIEPREHLIRQRKREVEQISERARTRKPIYERYQGIVKSIFTGLQKARTSILEFDKTITGNINDRLFNHLQEIKDPFNDHSSIDFDYFKESMSKPMKAMSIVSKYSEKFRKNFENEKQDFEKHKNSNTTDLSKNQSIKKDLAFKNIQGLINEIDKQNSQLVGMSQDIPEEIDKRDERIKEEQEEYERQRIRQRMHRHEL